MENMVYMPEISEQILPRRRLGRCLGSLAVLALLLVRPIEGRVSRITVDGSESPAFQDQSFGAIGQYVKLSGRAFGELDPENPLNSIITDIELAPRNAAGMVEYTATFTLVIPLDISKASGMLLYEVPNRGNTPIGTRPNEDDLRSGHVLLSSGWQGDVAPRPGAETIVVPVARNADGSSITGPVIARLSNLEAGSSTASLETGYGALRYQEPATLDTSSALLTRQASDDGQVTPIASDEWAFADCRSEPFPGEPDPKRICLKNGVDPELLYQVVYTAKDPLVLGIGLAATRDIVSFFRYAEQDSSGEGNPLAGIVTHAIGSGTSQSGNFIKTFLNLGFNQDEEGRIVWDGANPNIAARQCPLNFRFAIPGGAAGLYEPGSEGVLWWSKYEDKFRSRPAAGLLDRCRATETCPKIMETFGSAEFWGLRMSPGMVGAEADTDIPLPSAVRRYYFPGVTHGGGRGGFDTGSREGNRCTLPDNPNPSSDTMRALHLALIDWVANDTPPPESRYPRLDQGELVSPDHTAMGFPVIPGMPLPDNMVNVLPEYDFGQEFDYNDLSGVIAIQPPVIRRIIPMLVPRTDADGNEVGGIPSVLHQVPLGTYLGWNVTASGYLKGRTCGFSGGFIPFATTRAERLASGDPRPSLEERYGTHEAYVAKVRAAAERMVRERFLLEEDANRLVREAEESNVLR